MKDTTSLKDIKTRVAGMVNNLPPTESGKLVFTLKSNITLWDMELTPEQVSTLNYNLMNGIDTVFTIEAPKENNNG